MGYIDSFRDVMDMETGMLQYVMKLLEQDYKKELDMLGVTLPEVGRIPAVRFDQAKELVSRKYDRKIRNPYDLEPEEELLIGRYFRKSMEAILCSSHITLPKNGPSMPWTTRQTPDSL